MYTIKEVSEKLKISANAVRFYEEKGLIKPERGENNYRAYSVEDISRLEMTVLYRKMGFTVASIKAIMNSGRKGELLNQFVAQYNILDQHIHVMSQVREILGESIELLLNQSGCSGKMAERMTEKMERTASAVAASDEWEDEYFGNVDEIVEILGMQGYTCGREQIDDLIWVIWADKK